MKLREFCKVINDAGKEGHVSRVKHHLGVSLLVYEAKPLGFGTGSVLVKLYKGEWVAVDPLTSEVSSTTVRWK